MANHDQAAANLGESLLEEDRENEPRGAEYTNSLKQNCSAESVFEIYYTFYHVYNRYKCCFCLYLFNMFLLF